jgi:hypothetical protein
VSDTWLTPDELHELTGRQRYSAQCRALASMGVPFRPNAIGRPLVERSAVLSSPAPAKRKAQPNWSAIRGKAA